MQVELLIAGQGSPRVEGVTQVVIRNDQGTPICVALAYGTAGAVRVAHVQDPEFPRLLQLLGLPPVGLDEFHLPPPPAGARRLVVP